MNVAVWYDKQSSDPERPWLVCRLGSRNTVRAARVFFSGATFTAFVPEGFDDLLPGRPRGIIVTDEVHTEDEVPVGS